MVEDLVKVFDYSDKFEAARAGEILEQHGIPCIIQHEHETFNPAFTLKSSFNSIHLLVACTMAQRAREILGSNDSSHDQEPATEAFLADFSDEELLEVVAKSDEWNEETVRTAERMLRKRGIEITDVEKVEMEYRRIIEIRKPQTGDPVWMAIAFLSILAGGIFGILIGMGYRYLKDRDPNGRRFYIYDDHTRWWGGLFMIAGIVSFVLWFVVLITLGT